MAIAGISLPRTTYSSGDKEANVNNALDRIRNNDSKLLIGWLRDNKFNPIDLNDLVVQALPDLTSSDIPEGS
jgi:hypothetical protein